MKYFNAFLCLLAAAFTMAMSSCSSDDEDMEQLRVPQTTYVDVNDIPELLKAATEFNDSLKQTYTPTRGSKKKNIIIAADVVGALNGGFRGYDLGGKIGTAFGHPVSGRIIGTVVGGAAIGAFYSWRAKQMLENKFIRNEEDKYLDFAHNTDKVLTEDLDVNWMQVKYKDQTTKNKVCPSSSIKSKLNLQEDNLKIGEMHNIMLGSEDGYLSIGTTPTTRGYDLDTDNDDDELYPERNRFMADYNQRLLFEQVEQQEEDASTNSFIDLFCEAINNASQDDLIYIVNSYIDMVNNSDKLNDDVKTCYLNAFAVGFYSCYYWSEESK